MRRRQHLTRPDHDRAAHLAGQRVAGRGVDERGRERPCARRSLLAADLLIVQVQADRLIAAVEFYQALGGGWTLYAR